MDVKNPKEGPLGASFPWIIQGIKQAAPAKVEVSCTLGDVPNLPGTAALAALGAATLNVNYVKVGLGSLKTSEQAIPILQGVVRAVKDCNSNIKVVAAGYADAEKVGCVDPMLVPKIASAAKCDLAMLDTAVKDGKTLFDYFTEEQVRSFIGKTHRYGLQAALAGSLKKEQLPLLCRLGVDVVGLRGAACSGGDRVNGRITRENVRLLVQAVREAERLRGKGA